VGRTIGICVKFLCDVACQQLLKFANVLQSHSKNKSGMFFMDHSVLFT